MSYRLEIGPKAEKSFGKLPKEIALKLIRKLRDLEGDPFRYLKHFEGGGYKFRVGDYRAIVDVDFERRVF